VGVVAGCGEQSGGGLGADAVEGDEARRARGGEFVKVAVERSELGGEGEPAAGDGCQRELGGTGRGVDACGAKPGGALDDLGGRESVEPARRSSGAVTSRAWIWLLAWVRALMALRRATWSIRIASTEPVAVLGVALASRDCTERAAPMASAGSDLACRRRC
jgi:hypothetical protein